jgi:uncharacterized membrane protein (UPF0127 family)
MFMTMKIDVIFLDKNNVVCEIRKNLDVWKPFVSCPLAETVIELPCNAISASLTDTGDILDLNAELSEQKKSLQNTAEILRAPEAALPLNTMTEIPR